MDSQGAFSIAIAACARMRCGTPNAHAARRRLAKDCASHKSDCAKSARTFLLRAASLHRLSRLRGRKKTKPAALPPRVSGAT